MTSSWFLLSTLNILLHPALQLFVSSGLLNHSFPLLPLLRPLYPIAHSHLPQIIPHIVFPSYSWPSLRSCCIRFPFVYGLGHSFISQKLNIQNGHFIAPLSIAAVSHRKPASTGTSRDGYCPQRHHKMDTPILLEM